MILLSILFPCMFLRPVRYLQGYISTCIFWVYVELIQSFRDCLHIFFLVKMLNFCHVLFVYTRGVCCLKMEQYGNGLQSVKTWKPLWHSPIVHSSSFWQPLFQPYPGPDTQRALHKPSGALSMCCSMCFPPTQLAHWALWWADWETAQLQPTWCWL